MVVLGERVVVLSWSSSNPMYWNVRLWIKPWYEFVMMVWISLNSDVMELGGLVVGGGGGSLWRW